MDIPLTVTTEGGRPLAELQRLIQARERWMHETSEQSTTAAMIDVLVSLRSVTRIASPKKSEIKLERTPYRVSFS